MPSSELLYALLAATLLVAYMPGPGLIYTAAQTLARGRKAGLFAAFGLHIGGYVHVIAAAAGLSALFHAVPSMYLAVKLIGAGYLVLIGARMIWQAVVTENKALNPVESSVARGHKAFVQSVLVEVLNPKTALFFIAFLPQFVDPSASFPVWMQFIILGTFVNIMLSSADLLCVLFAGIVVDKLRTSSRLSRVMEGLGGSILVGLGVNLGLQQS